MLTPIACSSVDQALDRHLTLVILHQHEAAQLRPKMAADAAGQRRHDRLALRRQPALAAVAHHPRGQHQVLHLVRLVTFELRTRRMRHPQHLGLGHDPRRHLAAAAAFGPLAAGLRLGRVLHAARFDRRTALQTLQPSDLIALRRHDLLQFRYLAQQFHKPSFQLGTWQAGQIGGRRHATNELYSPASGEARKLPLPGVLPRLLWSRFKHPEQSAEDLRRSRLRCVSPSSRQRHVWTTNIASSPRWSEKSDFILGPIRIRGPPCRVPVSNQPVWRARDRLRNRPLFTSRQRPAAAFHVYASSPNTSPRWR